MPPVGGLILAATIVKGCLFAMAIPYGRAPDEQSHLNYVPHVLHTRRLPVHYFPGYELRHGHPPPHPHDALDPAAESLGGAVTDCSFNPPLYYLVCATVVGASRAGPSTAILLCRLVSIALSTATIYVFFLIARTLFPGDPWLGLGFPIAASFHPQFTFIGSVVSNDNIVNLIAAVLCLLWVRCILEGATSGRAVRMGVLTGLWFLGKASFTLAAFTSVFVLVVAATRQRAGPRKGVLLIGAYGLAAGILALPLAIRNVVIYGDIAGLSDMTSYFGEGSLFTDSLWEMGFGSLAEFPSSWSVAVFESFWGRFDWLHLPLPGWIYSVLLAALLIGAIGTGRHLWRNREKPEALSLLVLLLSAVVNLGMIAFYCYYFIYQPQGRYLFPSLFAIMAVLCVGLPALASGETSRRAVLAGVVASFVVLNFYSLFGLILPYYR